MHVHVRVQGGTLGFEEYNYVYQSHTSHVQFYDTPGLFKENSIEVVILSFTFPREYNSGMESDNMPWDASVQRSYRARTEC